MTYIDESVTLAAQATFGRDGAMFESLLGFVAQLSMVLWSLVILTAVFRFLGIRIYRKGARRAATRETAVPPAAVPPATVRPSVGTSVAVMTSTPRKPRSPRAEPRYRGQVHVHATSSMEL